MNAPLAPSESMPRHRWLIGAAGIFVAQAGFIFWLGAKHPITPQPPHSLPPIFLAADYDTGLAALLDPTLFALPSRHGFSGSAWALTPRAEYTAADWTEPFRPLPLAAEKLGASFHQLVRDTRTAPLPLAEKIEPPITALEIPTDFSPLPTKSWLRVEGAIAGRELIAPLDLPAWPNADILSASEVRVLVDAGGDIVSAGLLTSCGLNEADQKALELARTARFEALTDGDKTRLAHPLAGLSSGKMIFQWRTLAPLPVSEPPTENP